MKSGFWDQVLTYFYIRKRRKDAPHNSSFYLMHGMNRISIFVFLIAIIIMIIRLVRG